MQGTTPFKPLTLPEKVTAEKPLRTVKQRVWRKKCIRERFRTGQENHLRRTYFK
jgi:hypothetical protein